MCLLQTGRSHVGLYPVAGVSICVISNISCLVNCNLWPLFNQLTQVGSKYLQHVFLGECHFIQLVDKEFHLI